MKNTKTKRIGAIGLLGLGVLLLSFSKAGDAPEFVRYEVIRSVNGEVTIYDTIVDASSTFTPEQYLASLGFSEDENIEIIHLPHSHEMMMMHHAGEMHHAGDSLKIVRIGIDGTHPDMQNGQMIIMQHPGGAMRCDSVMTFDIRLDDEHKVMMDEHHQLMIEKNIVIKSIDSLDHEMVEMQRLIELVNLDSLVSVHHPGGGDSAMVFVHEIVIEEGNEGDRHKMISEEIHGQPTFERHTENGNLQSDIKIFGEKEDFTVVIVSDAVAEPKSGIKIEKSNTPAGGFKVYPNPASKEVTVQFNFDEKATTNITVSDADGKTVMEMSLGEFSGQHTETINVSKWSKGIYFVNVERPGTKMVEKLVIE